MSIHIKLGPGLAQLYFKASLSSEIFKTYVRMQAVEEIDLGGISLLSGFKFPKSGCLKKVTADFLGNLNTLSRLMSPGSIHSSARIRT